MKVQPLHHVNQIPVIVFREIILSQQGGFISFLAMSQGIDKGKETPVANLPDQAGIATFILPAR